MMLRAAWPSGLEVRGEVFVGLILIFVGVILLLERLNIISRGFHTYWPAILILLGLAFLARSIGKRK